MIQLKVVDLLNAEQILFKIKEDAEKNGTNLNSGYKLKRLLDKLTPEYKDIYEQRNKIFKEFGETEKDEEGVEKIRIPSERTSEFNKYWEELLNTKVELFNVFKFKLSEFSLNEKYTLQEINFLEPFIEEDSWEQEPEERSKININFDDNVQVENPEHEDSESPIDQKN